jgi:hypothetical protein
MITDLDELSIRLQTHFEIVAAEYPDTHPLGVALLSAIDLIDVIRRAMDRGGGIRSVLVTVVQGWENRSIDDGRPTPRPVD